MIRSLSRGSRLLALGSAVLSRFPVAAAAQDTAHRSASPTVLEAARQMEARKGAKIVVDPILAERALTGGWDLDTPIAACLERLCGRLRDADWRQVELPGAEPEPDSEKLAALVRALASQRLSASIETEQRGRFAALSRRTLGSPGRPEAGAGSQGIYVLFSTALPADGLTVGERFGVRQRELAALAASLPPEQRTNPMLAWANLVRNHDPATLERAMTPMAAAATRTWEQVDAGERESILSDSMDVMKRFGSGAGGTASAEPEPTARAGGRNLAPAAKTLSDTHHVTVLVEPAARTRRVPGGSIVAVTADAALDELVRRLPSMAWRRVYLVGDGELGQAQVRDLCDEARFARAAMPPWLRVEGDTSVLVTRLDEGADPVGFAARLAAMGFRAEPVYLVFDRYAGAALDPSARYAALVQQQTEAMMAMNADQLTEAFDQAVQMYRGSQGAARLDVAGLPSMAGMMAIWFPRAAKERASKP